MTSNQLKITAVVAMLLDHIGAVLFPNIIILRLIGRIAFPIFCFLIVEGYFHTKNVEKYIFRLGIFALISEIPFDLAIQSTFLEFTYQNVFFTLLLGLIAIYLYDSNKMTSHYLGGVISLIIVYVSVRRYIIEPFGFTSILVILSMIMIILVFTYNLALEKSRGVNLVTVFLLGILATIIPADYGMYGVFLVFIFYIFRDNFKMQGIIIGGLSLLIVLPPVLQGYFSVGYYAQAFQALALIFIYFYNGQKGRGMKYLFYTFYPVHLLVLAIIQMVY